MERLWRHPDRGCVLRLGRRYHRHAGGLLRQQKSAQQMGYAVAPVLEENKAYADGLAQGIGVLDKNLPFFNNKFSETDFFARRNLKQILEFIFADK